MIIKIGEFRTLNTGAITYSIDHDGEDWYPRLTIKSDRGSCKNGITAVDVYVSNELAAFLNECDSRVECLVAKANNEPVSEFRARIAGIEQAHTTEYKCPQRPIWNAKFFVENEE